MTDPKALFPALATLNGKTLDKPHCRVVERVVLESKTPSEFLYTSGRPGRYNPRGVNALYCSQDLPTAGAEVERYRNGKTRQLITYWIHPRALVLDLEEPAILNALGLTTADLFAPWRFAPSLTKAQLLGEAVEAIANFAGIRFPSDAARERGFTGYNVVFFKRAVVSPASVVVLDDTGHEVGRWP